MKIKNLTIKNYKGIERLSIDFDGRPVVLTGKNGRGKTSTLQALKFLLHGGNPGDLSKMEYLLRKGAKKGSVSCKTQDGHEIVRYIKPHRIKVDGKDEGIGEGQTEICNLARCRKREIELCLTPENFLALDSKEQREKLWDLLKLSITPDLVKDKLELHGLLDQYLEFTEQTEVSADIDGPKSTFYNARTDANRAKKNAKAALEKMQEEADAGKAPPKVDKPDEEALKQASDTLQGMNRVIGRFEAAQKEHEKKLAKLAKLKEEAGELPGWDREKALEKLMVLEKEYHEKHYLLNEPKRLKNELGRLQSDQCPSCKRVWDDLDERQKRRDELKSQIKEAEDNADAVLRLKARCDKGRRAIQEFDAAMNSRVQILELEKEVENFSQPTIPPEQLQQAQEKFNHLSADWQKWQTYQSWQNRRKQLEADFKKATEEWDVLNRLYNLFGPNGIKFQTFAEAGEEVCNSLNGTLGLFDIMVRFNGELELEICRDGIWRLVDGASDGERIMVALAIQVWIAEGAPCGDIHQSSGGLRIVCLDRLEALDRENFLMLVNALCELLEHDVIDHAIVGDVGFADDDPIIKDKVQTILLLSAEDQKNLSIALTT